MGQSKSKLRGTQEEAVKAHSNGIRAKLSALHRKRLFRVGKKKVSGECPICLCDCLNVPMQCGHVMHDECLEMQLEVGLKTLEETGVIQFGFMACPLCREQVAHSSVKKTLRPLVKLRTVTDTVALESGKDLASVILPDESKALETLDSMSVPEKLDLIYRKMRFYQCTQCKAPYYGGLKSCADAIVAARDAVENEQQEEEDYPAEMEIAPVNPLTDSIKLELAEQENPLEDGALKNFQIPQPPERPLSKHEIVSNAPAPPVRPLAKHEQVVNYAAFVVVNPPEVEVPPEEEEVENHQHLHNQDEKKKKEHRRLCQNCTIPKICEHDTNLLLFKCIRCCQPALFNCGGTYFYCNRCHSDWVSLFPCDKENCPLGGEHPPNLGPSDAPNEVCIISCTVCGEKPRRKDEIAAMLIF